MTIHIAITPDNNVVNPTIVLLNSIRKSNAGSKFKIHLIHCQLSDENLIKIMAFAKSLKFSITDYFIDPELLENIRTKINSENLTRITASTLIRCMISDILPKSLKRIIYLDTDIVVIRPIAPLFKIDLKGKTAGAVIGGKHNHLFESFGINSDNYFNAGVLLIDFKSWQKNLISEKARNILTERSEHCLYLDQCALNIALKGKIKKIPTHWNVFSVREDKLKHLREVSIIHYVGPIKPWEWPEHHPFGVFYYLYCKGTPAQIEFDAQKIAPPKKFFRIESIKRAPYRFKKSILKRLYKIWKPPVKTI